MAARINLLPPGNFPFTFEIPTRFADLDSLGHVNNASLVVLFEEARIRMYIGMGVGSVFTGDVRQIVVSSLIEYRAETFYPDPITIHCGIDEIGTSSWRALHVGYQRGEVVAAMQVVQVHTRAGRPAPIEDDFRTMLAGALVHGASS